MKKIVSLLLSIILMFSCAQALAREATEKSTYIVVLDAPSVYSPERITVYGSDDSVYREALIELQAQIKEQIPASSAYSLRSREKTYTYTDVINGFTVNVDAATAEKIKKIDGVKGVYENKTLTLSEPVKATDEDAAVSQEADAVSESGVSSANSGNMTGVQYAYNEGYNGQGRAIAIIDSAMNPYHIYYGLSGEETAKYSQGEIAEILEKNNMNTSATGSTAYKNAKVPYAYNYPEDSADVYGTNLHGAHVAGIAAGNSITLADGQISGIAPEAQILFFGVTSAEGTISTDDVIAALEDVSKFDVDAVNLSLGADYASEYLGEGPLNDAVIALRNSGKTVVFAAGNSNKASYLPTFCDYGTSDNRSYLYSSSVGSVQSEYAFMRYLEDDSGNKYPCVAKGSTVAFSALDIADCGSGTQTEIAAAQVQGKVAVIKMPDNAVAQNILTYGARAMNAGASAVVLGYFSDDLPDGNSGVAYPLFTVSRDSATAILQNAQSLKNTAQSAVLQRVNAPRENTYSSYGYSDNLDISVDFSAPGGNIFSSYGGTSGFANLSGTSMAAPQVTGATSLMYQYVEEKFPHVTGQNKVMLVKNLLASTAETVYDSMGTVSSPRKVGSGLIRLDRAMETKIILQDKTTGETKISLGANLQNTFNVTFTAVNLSSEDVVFENMEVELSSDDYKNYQGTGYRFCGLRNLQTAYSQATPITVPANGQTEVSIEVTLSDEDIEYLSAVMTNGFFIDGKVTLSSNGNCDVGIPFTGFYGNWASQPIMTDDRFLNYVKLEGFSEDGFTPPMMLLSENGEVVMPISDSPDESVSQIPVAVFANPYRNAFMTVKCDGVAVLEDAFINKFHDLGYYLGDALIGDLSSVSQIAVELRLPYDTQGEHTETHIIKIVKDNTMPVISDVYTSTSEGADLAHVLVSDERGISAVTMMGEYGGELYIGDAYIGKKSAEVAFDITALDNICYYVYDCAFNMTSLLPHVGIDVAGNKAVYTNNIQTPLTGECLIAVYDEDRRMKKLERLSDVPVTIDAYDTCEFNVSQYEGQTYKLFFWADTDSCMPLCDAYETE